MEQFPTLAEHVEAWLAVQRGQVQPSTLQTYRRQLEGYALPRLGALHLDEITPRTLSAAWVELLETGAQDGGRLSLQTVRHVHDVVGHALQWAVDEELLAVNPARRARPPRVDPAADEVDDTDRFRMWTGPQAARFLRLTRDHRFWLVFLLALSTGMRRGEILGLRWDDVDCSAGELHVRRALSVADGRLLLKRPKSGRSRRIGVDERVVRALAARRREQTALRRAAGDAWEDRWGLVITKETGAPIHPSRVSGTFAKLVRKLDVPNIRFHDTRHSHASLLLLAGVPVHVVAQRLGHAKAAMTLNVYAHVLPSADDEAVRQLSRALYGPEDDARPPSAAAPPPPPATPRRVPDRPPTGPVQPSLLDEP